MHHIRGTVSIETDDGTVSIPFSDKNIKSDSFSISSQCVSGNAFEIGAVCSKELNMTITGTKTFSTLGWGGGTTYNLNSTGGINSANINANGFVRPSASNTYTCGQSTRKWSNCYATTFNGSLADYAEYFEWSDGNPENQDRRGLFVTILDGEKISIAGENDDILGIVSAAPLLVGDCITDEWSGKYKVEFQRL